MQYAGLKYNDIVNGEGISVSYWAQGCPFHCKNCHNPQTWDFNGGLTIDIDELIEIIIEALDKNGIQRNFSILGGEPFCPQNINNTIKIGYAVRKHFKGTDRKIYAWTGYQYDELKNEDLSWIDVLIDGPYIEDQHDIRLKLRGSKNQNIIFLHKNI